MRHDSRRVDFLLLLSLLLACTSTLSASFLEGDLPRRADLGFRVTGDPAGLRVTQVSEASPARQAGLQVEDRIQAINGQRFGPSFEGEDLLEKLDGDQVVTLSVLRGDRPQSITFTPPPRPLESIAGVDTYYGVVETSDGARLRTLISRPAGSQGESPGLFFVQWVSCGSLEYVEGSVSRGILARLAQESGRVLIRVERTTSGDSEGPGCHALDYDTEMRHYLEAYRQVVDGPHVDAANVVLYGSSLGSTTAPLIAQRLLAEGRPVAGIAVQGGGAVTYLERMIQFDRTYLERGQGFDPARIHREMNDRIRFHHEYLVRMRSPDAVATDSEAMARVRADVRGLGQGVHYGRPYAWHQQAAQHDFLAAWAEIDAPVLVVFNQYDQFEGRHGHRLIVDTVNRLRPGTASWVEQSGMGHSNFQYPNAIDAYRGENGSPDADGITDHLLRWLGGLH